MKILKIKNWIAKYNPYLKQSWDASGYKKHLHLLGDGQNQWSNTLLSRINEISAHIHMSTQIGGADTIELHSENMPILRGIEYYRESTNKIGSRYDVIINNSIDINLVLVYKRDISLLSNNKQKNISGAVYIKNRI